MNDGERYPVERVLVSGGSGFVGQAVVNRLRELDCEVRSLSRSIPAVQAPGVRYLVADLEEPDTLADVAGGADTLLHVAGYAHATSRVSPDELAKHRRINLEGTGRLLEGALAAGVKRFVYVSSVKAGGDDPERCLDEHAGLSSAEPYGRIKREAEQLVLERCAQAGIHCAVLRPALVYGRGVKGNIAAMTRWIERGVFPPVPDTGNIRSMVEVRDLAEAIIAAAACPAANGEVIIVTDGQDYSTRRIYEAICRSLGRRPANWSVPVGLLRWLGRAGDLLEHISGRSLPVNSALISRLLDSACYRSGRARDLLGFSPRYTLEQSLARRAENPGDTAANLGR